MTGSETLSSEGGSRHAQTYLIVQHYAVLEGGAALLQKRCWPAHPAFSSRSLCHIWMLVIVRKQCIYLSGCCMGPETGPHTSPSRNSTPSPWPVVSPIRCGISQAVPALRSPEGAVLRASSPRSLRAANQIGTTRLNSEIFLWCVGGQGSLTILAPVLLLSFLFCKMGIFNTCFNKCSRPLRSALQILIQLMLRATL